MKRFLTGTLRPLARLLEHYEGAQLESLLAPEALLVVHATLEGEGATARLREALEAGATPGQVLVQLTERHGARAVWAALPPRWRLDGAGDALPTPTSEPTSGELPRVAIVGIVVATIAVVVPALVVLHPVSGASAMTVMVVAMTVHAAAGIRVLGGPGVLGAIVANVVGAVIAVALRDAGFGVSKTAMFACVLPALAAGALVAFGLRRLLRPAETPPETF